MDSTIQGNLVLFPILGWEFRSFEEDDLSVAFNIFGGETMVLSTLADEIYTLLKAQSETVEKLKLLFSNRYPEIDSELISEEVDQAIGQLRAAGALVFLSP